MLTYLVEGVEFSHHLAKDTPELAGAAINWVISGQAQLLNGRYVIANWDVTELLARKEEILGKSLLTISLDRITGQTAELRKGALNYREVMCSCFCCEERPRLF
jgi:hypothetical protein